MKTEKLKLMLNKVVNYNNPSANDGKGNNFKAFLYKNSNGYYFKIVEIISGNDIKFNDIVYLKKNDEKFITVADKPKLMRITKNSWHYRLVKYVLRKNAPTPKDMQNGCPYFWLLMFSILVIPFILLGKLIKEIFIFIPRIVIWFLEKIVLNWMAGLDDMMAYDFYNMGKYGAFEKMPKTAEIYFINKKYKFLDTDKFLDTYLEKKYNLTKDDPKYLEKINIIAENWKKWRENFNQKREEKRKINAIKENERIEKNKIREKAREESRLRWEKRMKPIEDGFDKIYDWFNKTFTVERGKRNMIIKRTKQFTGGIINLLVLAFTYIVVNYISLGLMVVIDWCINHWEIFAGIGLIAITSGIVYVLYILISSWGQNIVNKYDQGKKIWYVEPLIYLIWYPVKYIAIVIAFIITKIIWSIVKFIFYVAIFKYFLKPIGLFIAKIVIKLVKGIVSSTGIFGEYFGASYSDYCPGIEWVGFDEEENNKDN